MVRSWEGRFVNRRMAYLGRSRPSVWGWVVLALIPVGLASWLVCGAWVGSGSLVIVFSRNRAPYPVPPHDAQRLTVELFGRSWLPPKGESVSEAVPHLLSGHLARQLSPGRAIVARPGLLSFAIKYDQALIYRGQATISKNSTTNYRVPLEDTIRTLIVSNLPAPSKLTDEVSGARLQGGSFQLPNLALGQSRRLLLEVAGYQPCTLSIVPTNLSPLLLYTNPVLTEPIVVLHCVSALRGSIRSFLELAHKAEWAVESGPGQGWRGRTNRAGVATRLLTGKYILRVWHRDFESAKVSALVAVGTNDFTVRLVPLPARLTIDSTPAARVAQVWEGTNNIPLQGTNAVVLTPVLHRLKFYFDGGYEPAVFSLEPEPNSRITNRFSLLRTGMRDFNSLTNRLPTLLTRSNRRAPDELGGRDWVRLHIELTNAIARGRTAPHAAIPVLTDIESRLTALLSVVKERQWFGTAFRAALQGHSISNCVAALKCIADYEDYLATHGIGEANDPDVVRLQTTLSLTVGEIAQQHVDSLLARSEFSTATAWLSAFPGSLRHCLGRDGIEPLKERLKTARDNYDRVQFRSQMEAALLRHDFAAASSYLAQSSARFPDKDADRDQLAAKLIADRRVLFAARLRTTCEKGRLDPKAVSAILSELVASGGSSDRRVIEAFLISELLAQQSIGAALGAIDLFEKAGAGSPWRPPELVELKDLIKRHNGKIQLSPEDQAAVERLRNSLK